MAGNANNSNPRDAVLDAVTKAFKVGPSQLTDQLIVSDGRVFGKVIVANSPAFAKTPGVERYRLMWDQLRKAAGSASVRVGVVQLLTPGQAQGTEPLI